MVTLETTYGRFEAETEQDALKQSRRAKRQAAKQDKIDAQNRETAVLRARDNGYRILSRIASGEPMLGGWRVLRTNDRYSSCRVEVLSMSGRKLHLDCEHGRAVADLYNVTPESYVENGAGFPMAVFVRVDDALQCWAVGTQSDQHAFEPLPGVTPEQFDTDDSIDVEARHSELPTVT